MIAPRVALHNIFNVPKRESVLCRRVIRFAWNQIKSWYILYLLDNFGI